MRIGIDARELGGRATGAGRYLAGLLHEWQMDPDARRHQFVLYATEALTVALDPRQFTLRLVPGRPNTWWEQTHLARAARADQLDVMFCPAYSAPLLLHVPVVVAIHDVSFVAHPEWFRPREGWRRRWLSRASASRARAVVTISEFSRREIADRLGIPPSRIHVIPPGIAVARPVRAGVDAAVEAAADAHADERVLFVGSIFNRRRVPDLVRSFAAVARRRPGASLDLVGDNRTFPHQDLPKAIAAERLDGRIRWHRYASEPHLDQLYKRARAFAFLSEYEGLGLTPLEALAAGVPPVLLDTPVARESCGEAALYVAPGDLDGTADALEQALADPAVRSRLLAAAPAALARYQWPRAAKDTLALLETEGA